jgi:hypothetical protein
VEAVGKPRNVTCQQRLTDKLIFFKSIGERTAIFMVAWHLFSNMEKKLAP